MAPPTVLRPSPIFLFDKSVLSLYASRIVRREMFLVYCSPSHSCVVEEDRLIAVSEHEIATLIRVNRLCPPSSSLVEAFTSYVRRLILINIDQTDCDLQTKREVASKLASYNLETPFDLARIEVSA